MKRRDFGRYKIIEEVGRGAMGVVYRAMDPVVRRVVALKAINQTYLEGVGVTASEYLERFQREAEVAGRLSHPAIVKIFDLGDDYLVMEFVEGQSLASLLSAKQRLPPDQILQIVAEVADAVDHAHEHGIVHRDIKPANIMIQPDGSPKVMDFGLARLDSSKLTAAGEILGSASYMAPEVILGNPADARSDIFSLGVVAYELMTGDRPFGGGSITVIIQNVVRAKPRSARTLNPNLPSDYDAIFDRALAKDPSSRYATACEFASELMLWKWSEAELGPPPAMPSFVDEGADTIPPGIPADTSDTTVLLAEAGEVDDQDTEEGRSETLATTATPAAGAVAPPATTLAIPLAPIPRALPTDAYTLPPAPLADELPFASREPVDEELARLATQTVTSVPTVTRPAGSEVQLAAQAAAATTGGMGPSDVLGDEQPGTPVTAPATDRASLAPAPKPGSLPVVTRSPRRKGPSLAATVVLGAGLLLVLAFGLSVVAYRLLVQRVASAPAASTAPVAKTPTAPPETMAAEAPPEEPPSPPAPPSRLLAPQLAAFSITSEPPGGRVTIGKKQRGLAPLRLQLPPGRLSILVEKDGFKPWNKDVTLFSGGLEMEARLEAVTPEPTAKPTPPPVRTGDLVALSADVTPPKRIVSESPKLSKAAEKMKLSGSVMLEFVVDEAGNVSDPKVLESAGELLDGACLEAVRRWRYEPATTQGVKVKVVQKAKFTFQTR